MALELGSRNIRSELDAPGFIETEMTGALDEGGGGAGARPFPWRGTPADVANACVFPGPSTSAPTSPPDPARLRGMLT